MHIIKIHKYSIKKYIISFTICIHIYLDTYGMEF